jgi:hypothetical protein
MATTTELTRYIDASLWAIGAEADFLPELAEDWEKDPYNRATWENEWDVLFMRLSGLDDAYRAGEMTAEQQECYQALRAKLSELLPLFEQLRLPLPSTSLDP